MTTNTWGGKRIAGEGRKIGRPKGDPTEVVRLPADLVAEIRAQLDRGATVADLIARLRQTALAAPLTEPLINPIETTPAVRAPLEQALLYLAGRCDGAQSRDDAGFNGADTAYGHWLADMIDADRPLLRKHAESAYKMLRKYQRQLSEAGIVVLPWEQLEGRYAETAAPAAPGPAVDAPPERRIDLRDQDLIVYSPYDPEAVAKTKAIRPAGQFNKYKTGDKGWYFPLTAAEALLNAFPDYAIDPAIVALVEDARAEKLRAAVEAAQGILDLVEAARLDEPLPNGRILFAHQKDAVRWLLAHRRGGLLRGGVLADHMGLGKTLSALVAAKAMRATYSCPILVVAPASLRDNWLREAEIAGVPIEIFSWAKMPKPLETRQYIVIADEAHYAQNLSSARTQALLALADSPNCLASWLLTGTPIKNGRPVNLFPLLVATGHPLSRDRRSYERHYCAAHEKSVGRGKAIWDVTGAAHLDELSKKTSDVILRRTKKECLDLPEKLRQMRPAELSNEAERVYDAKLQELVASYRARIASGEVSDDAEALVTLGQLRLAGSVAKVESAIELTEELREQGQSVVIFTEFVESARTLHAALGGELLTGETPTEERQAIVDRFQGGQSTVFIGTIKAGGVGLTLTAASHVILVDRPWTPGDAEQAEDRLHRIGQGQAVNAIWLQHGAIDRAIDSLLEAKQERIDLVLKGKRKTLRGLGSITELAKELLSLL